MIGPALAETAVFPMDRNQCQVADRQANQFAVLTKQLMPEYHAERDESKTQSGSEQDWRFAMLQISGHDCE